MSAGRRLLLTFLLAAAPAVAKVFLTQEEALKLAFPPGTVVERRTSYLSADQKAEVKRLAGTEPSGLAVAYVGTRDGREAGTAYFETHVVRTQAETLLVVVTPDGALGRVEILSFAEPEEYLPRASWYGQLPGKRLDDELASKRGVRPVTGATLTVRATVEAARRVLALHQVLRQAAAASGGPAR